MIEVRPIASWRYEPGHIRLDSASGSPSPWSRWTYRLGPARLSLHCDRLTRTANLRGATGLIRQWNDPLAALRWMSGYAVAQGGADAPPFIGGWVGFLSYDLGHLFETLPSAAADDMAVPLFEFTFHDSLDAQAADGRLIAIDWLETPREGEVARRTSSAGRAIPLHSNFTADEYRAAVKRVIKYIRAGDVFQVNLSQRFTCGQAGLAPGTIYADLLRQFPAWYGAYLNQGDYALLCNSPELFLRVSPGSNGRTILTRPIKGTRPRGAGMRHALAESVKDQAELNMIVDLERNDLGRICRVGSIHVGEPRVIEEHPTVFHGAASIGGLLRDDVDFVDLLRATFPGGSVTGAPKIRAMEIIDELEPVRRGPYCGAIGYLSLDGHLEFNVAIRTIIFEGGRVHVPVGGGIVADSDPAAEYEETLVKARAMFAALGLTPPST